MNKTIGFIGAGNMASALIGGLLANGTQANTIHASDVSSEQLEKLANTYSIHTTQDNHQLIQQCDIVVLSVKPQVMKNVITELATSLQTKTPLLISIAAGITIDSLTQWIGKTLPVVRCMPNTPALLKLGASGLFANQACSPQHKQAAQNILEAVGIVEWLESETNIDAVTALSGSGPAYFFLMMEAMIAAGKTLGLSESTASQLCIQTALGAASMAQHSDVDIAELRRRVTSPKGTTEAALNSFAHNQFNDIVKQAMQAANTRSIELSRE